MWLLWFATAFTYYGVILAQSEILEFHKVCGAGMYACLAIFDTHRLPPYVNVYVYLAKYSKPTQQNLVGYL